MYLPPFPLLGGLLAWATVYLLGFKRTRWDDFLLGLGAFLLAMILQNPIQQLPLLGIGIRSNADVVARGTVFTMGVALWVGIVAGFVQEGVKYFFIKDRGMRTALFVGLGFGVTEAMFVAVISAIAVAATGGKIDVPVVQALLSAVERYFVVLFHVGSAIYLAHAAGSGFGRRGFLAMAVLHGFVDTLAVYGQFLTLKSEEY